jgi:hypothetical protein
MPNSNLKKPRISSNYSGLFVIYLVSIVVAFTVIIPNEEVWYFGILKASLWPLYAITKII